jgi:hypothetical protein
MGDFYGPIDFSGLVGYPHYESSEVFENTPDYGDRDDANTHIRAFTKCIDEWYDPPIYEDVLMKLFAIILDWEKPLHWFHDSPDGRFKNIQGLLHAFLERFGHDRSEVYDELVDEFMETWKRKNLLAFKTINTDIEVDSPSDPIKEPKEIIQNVHFPHKEQCETMNGQLTALEDQLEVIDDDFTEAYIEYPDPLELKIDNEKNEEVHAEVLDGSMDESVIYFEEVKELELENVEYLDDSSPHPPPEEPIFLKGNFENLEENSMMVPMVCSFPTLQPEDELIQNYVEMKGNFSLLMSYHYEYWLASHLDSHEQQSIQSLHNLSYSSVWLKGRRSMVLGWFFHTKSSKLIKFGKGSSVSHPGLGCLRRLWHHFTHCMGGCNVSLTLPCIFNSVLFDSLCKYVLRNFFFYTIDFICRKL